MALFQPCLIQSQKIPLEQVSTAAVWTSTDKFHCKTFRLKLRWAWSCGDTGSGPCRWSCTGQRSEPSSSSERAASTGLLGYPVSERDGQMWWWTQLHYSTSFEFDFGEGESQTSLCSRQAMRISDRMTTPVRPTPALQWTSTGRLAFFGSLMLFMCLLTDWTSSRKAGKTE